MNRHHLLSAIILCLFSACGKAPMTEAINPDEDKALQSLLSAGQSKQAGRGFKGSGGAGAYGAILWGNNLAKPGHRCLKWNFTVTNSETLSVLAIRSEKSDSAVLGEEVQCVSQSVVTVDSQTRAFKDGIAVQSSSLHLVIDGTVQTCNGNKSETIHLEVGNDGRDHFRVTFLNGIAVLKGSLVNNNVPYPTPVP